MGTASPMEARLSRSEIRGLKKEVISQSSGQAAERLLADSIHKGHARLALHRYFVLHRIDATRCAPFEAYCQEIADCMGNEELVKIIEHVDRAQVNLMKYN